MPDCCPCPRLLLTLTPASMAAFANHSAVLKPQIHYFCTVQYICLSSDLATKGSDTKEEAYITFMLTAASNVLARTQAWQSKCRLAPQQ